MEPAGVGDAGSRTARPVTVVLVHWNQPERLETAIAAFQRSTVPVELIVADSASEPEAQRALEALGRSPSIEVVQAGSNRGFGPTANVGLRHWLTERTGEWVALAPHDALAEPSTLERLLAAAAVRPGAGLVSADVGDGASPVVDRYFGGMTRPRAVDAGWESVDYPHGTLMLLRRSFLEDVGLFDERYSSYCEEADLGLRAADAGYEVGLVRGAQVRNPHLSSRIWAVDYLQSRNTLLLVRDHFGRYPALIRLLMLVYETAAAVVAPHRRPAVFDARARWQAVADHLRGRYGPPPESLARR
ncbi:MAG: glycosyltransferase [Actinomycetota bacterium]